MTLQHNIPSIEQQQEPAQKSSKASGEIVGRYLTKTGKVGVLIRACAGGRFRYIGEWGAGSGHSEDTMRGFLQGMLRGRRGVQVDVVFAGVQA